MAGFKYDSGKTRWELLPMETVEELAKVMTYGATKYPDDNWKKLENAEDRYFAAAMRHLSKHRAGELVDEDSGLLHAAHAACCLLMVLWFATHPKAQCVPPMQPPRPEFQPERFRVPPPPPIPPLRVGQYPAPVEDSCDD
jgi:hypothetical protein